GIVKATAGDRVAIEIRSLQIGLAPTKPLRVTDGLVLDAELQVSPKEWTGANHALTRLRPAVRIHGIQRLATRTGIVIDDLLWDDHRVRVSHEVIKRRNRSLGLYVDRVGVRRRNRIDRFVLTAAIVITLLNALGGVLLPLVAVDDILRGQLSPCQRREVPAYSVGAVVLDTLAQLHHVLSRLIGAADHLRRTFRQVR